MRPPSLLVVLDSWQLSASVMLTLALGAALYLVAARRVCGRARPGRMGWSLPRTLAFLAGLGAVALALQSGLDTYSAQLLSMHMVQHLVLVLTAAPLLLAGAPVTLALRALSPPARRRLMPLLHGRTARTLARPGVGLLAIGASMLLTHLTPLFGLALTHPLIHQGEHLLYLVGGMLFWSVLIPPGPAVRRLDGLGQVVYLLLGMPLMSVVGVILETDSAPRYPQYLPTAHRLGVSALSDQRLAGALMWIAGTLLMGVIALAAAWRSMLAEERREAAREAHADRRDGQPAGGEIVTGGTA
ncbi:MAG: cytochrome c oxidase assembly protein [Solirubrobacteraceae bacterium]